MAKIYGIDPNKPFTAVQVRNAIVDCFTKAHKEILDRDLGDLADKMSDKELKQLEELNVRQMIQVYFKDVGGDFDNPTKKSIIDVCDKLADFASYFRGQDTIKKHYGEIMQLVDKLEE